jgi:hypothetical protein
MVVKKIKDYEADKASESKARAEYKHYNRAALRFAKDQYNLKFLLGNSYLYFTAKYVPEQVNKDGHHLVLRHSHSY